MNRFGIIAGGGKLPLIIYNSLLKKNKETYIIGIKNNFNSKKIKNNFIEVKLGSLSKILNFLKKNKIKYLIFAGSIKRPGVMDFTLDFKAINFLKNSRLDKLGDNNLLKIISNYFEKKGYKFINWNSYCPDLFAYDNFLTTKKPSKKAYENLTKGLNVFKYYGKSDVGQSLIIQNNIILGLESIEGTDNLIKRCVNYKRKGDKGILLKLMKYSQDIRFDLPTIGINTIKLIKKYNYEGIFIQKKYCLIIEKEKVIKFANTNNLFIAGVDQPWVEI